MGSGEAHLSHEELKAVRCQTDSSTWWKVLWLHKEATDKGLKRVEIRKEQKDRSPSFCCVGRTLVGTLNLW